MEGSTMTPSRMLFVIAISPLKGIEYFDSGITMFSATWKVY
jgi:hypothetical protein